MFVLLTLGLVCTAAASSGYGANNYDRPSYQGPSYGGNHGYYDYSSSESSSSEEKHRRHCKKPQKLSVPDGIKNLAKSAQFLTLERKGKQYTKISCPNDGNAYLLLGEKEGSDVSNGDHTVNDSILLAEGVNLDLVGKCKGRNVHVKAANGDRIKVKKVVCVKLEGLPDKF
ncbi:Protein CBG15570 [Caenorhabditis briggsae]|uniref:Protein CBG15570 n=2 Tax=Caenorhabditis briggsae TaxID=6238 RepID=A8XM47_CAEBR|nr:Protein CBG15570 [Caenorhabditis briggsae]ULT83753.1 hypothetical protein L3Y34_012781 [Caenorhabditis briggsae]CAP33722.1 Protein CBG15570 [Caenorhabditis briggsae]